MCLRYVDDTFMVINNCELEWLHESLNGVFPALQFTREGATGDILPFLDVTVQRLSDGKLATSVHRKDSNAEIILNYGSNHPATYKRSCVRTFSPRLPDTLRSARFASDVATRSRPNRNDELVRPGRQAAQQYPPNGQPPVSGHLMTVRPSQQTSTTCPTELVQHRSPAQE
ncbi:unnamed protein product [Schistocephalus solidus]|uniref:Reverse transcriptase domain-containing protein n=1 Tax=Schistocephalus solidus TaxID=70667 RepID=A0A183SK00_SCHSO|nr:unnamed protein product [Schistocephalus solidus]